MGFKIYISYPTTPIKLIKTHHLQDICVNNVCFYIFDISPSFYLFSSIIWEKGDGVKCPTTLVKYQIFNEFELITKFDCKILIGSLFSLTSSNLYMKCLIN